jgi:hypothetical protein
MESCTYFACLVAWVLYFEVLVVLAEGVSDHLGCDGKPLELLG